MTKLRCTPSDYFIGAIRRAYQQAQKSHSPVTPSGIWDYICMAGFPVHGEFVALFAWDTSNAKSVNRIGTIMETIKAGYVAGLRLGQDAKGRAIVVEA